jgi:hypothetical protein
MRKDDSGWRDGALNDWHARHGFPCPAAGMVLPMIEYDRGRAVGLVNYVRRGDALAHGKEAAATFAAFRNVGGGYGDQLPFLTAQYDPRNWAMCLFPHNPAAAGLLDNEEANSRGWVTVSEECFAGLLYAMRGRELPDLFGYDVTWSESEWLRLEPLGERPELPFPCSDMSARRRLYEPRGSAPMRVKLPCLDIDLAVTDQNDRLALVVDYKRMSAVCDPSGTNATALASLWSRSDHQVPAFMTRYFGVEPGRYRFETMPLNASAQHLLCYALGANDANDETLARAVGGGWVRLSEPQWLDVLRIARDV